MSLYLFLLKVEASTALTMRIASSFDVACGAPPVGCTELDDPAGFSRLATAVCLKPTLLYLTNASDYI